MNKDETLNKLKSLKVAKSKADGGVGDDSLDGGGVNDGGMNACVCDGVYDVVCDVVCDVREILVIWGFDS